MVAAALLTTLEYFSSVGIIKNKKIQQDPREIDGGSGGDGGNVSAPKGEF